MTWPTWLFDLAYNLTGIRSARCRPWSVWSLEPGDRPSIKVTNEPEELIGVRALEQWGGNGAVRVLVRDGNAIGLERAGETLRSLIRDDARPLKCRAARLSVSTPYRVENCVYRR